MEIYQTGSIIVILVGKRVLNYNIQFYIVIDLYNNPDSNERFKELLFKNYYNDCPVYTVFDNYIQFDEEEYDLEEEVDLEEEEVEELEEVELEEENDTIDRNFFMIMELMIWIFVVMIILTLINKINNLILLRFITISMNKRIVIRIHQIIQV